MKELWHMWQEYQKAFTYLTKKLKQYEKTRSDPEEFKDLCYLLTCRSISVRVEENLRISFGVYIRVIWKTRSEPKEFKDSCYLLTYTSISVCVGVTLRTFSLICIGVIWKTRLDPKEFKDLCYLLTYTSISVCVGVTLSIFSLICIGVIFQNLVLSCAIFSPTVLFLYMLEWLWKCVLSLRQPFYFGMCCNDFEHVCSLRACRSISVCIGYWRDWQDVYSTKSPIVIPEYVVRICVYILSAVRGKCE